MATGHGTCPLKKASTGSDCVPRSSHHHGIPFSVELWGRQNGSRGPSREAQNPLENLTLLVSGTELVQFLALPTTDAESLGSEGRYPKVLYVYGRLEKSS